MHASIRNVGRSPTLSLRLLLLGLIGGLFSGPKLSAQSLLDDQIWSRSTHQGVSALALSPDETFFVSAGFGIKVWRFSTPDLLRTIDPDGSYSSVALTSKGQLLYSAENHNHSINIWQISDGALLRAWTEGQTPLNAICLSPNDSLLAVGSGNPSYPGPYDGAVRLRSAVDGSLIRTFTNQIEAVTGVACSPDGDLLAAASGDQAVYLWRVNDGALLWSIPGTDGYRPAKVAFSRDGQTLAYGGGYGPSYVRLVNVSDGKPLWTASAHENELEALEFAPDGSFLVSAGARNHREAGAETNYPSIILYNPADGTRAGILPSSLTPVSALAVTRDSSRVLSSDLNLWQTNGVQVGTWAYNRIPGNSMPEIDALAFVTSRQELLSAHGGDGLKLWGAGDGALLRTNATVGFTFCIAYSPDESRVAVGGGSRITVINATNLSMLCFTNSGTRTVSSIGWSHNGSTLVVGESQGGSSQITLRNPTNCAVLHTFAPVSSNVLALTVPPSDSGVVSVAADGKVQFWDLFGLASTINLSNSPACASFSRDSSFLVAGYYNRDVRVLRLNDGAVRTLRGHVGSVTCVAISDDNQLVYSAGHNELLLWRAADGLLLKRYTQDVFDAGSLAASPRGDTFALGNRQVTLICARKPDFFLPVPPPQNGAITLSFSGVIGANYTLESSADLGNWLFWTNVVCLNSPASVLVPVPVSGPQFFRLKR